MHLQSGPSSPTVPFERASLLVATFAVMEHARAIKFETASDAVPANETGPPNAFFYPSLLRPEGGGLNEHSERGKRREPPWPDGWCDRE